MRTWSCPDCTFENADSNMHCEICFRARHHGQGTDTPTAVGAALGAPLQHIHPAPAAMHSRFHAAMAHNMQAPAFMGAPGDHARRHTAMEGAPFGVHQQIAMQLQAVNMHAARLAQSGVPQMPFAPQPSGYPTPSALPGLSPEMEDLMNRRRALDSLIQQIEVDGPRQQPAPTDAVQSLPTCVLCEEDVARLPAEHKTCTICMEDFADGDELRMLPCFHRFHKGCVDEWLRRSGTCPTCKHRVDEDGADTSTGE